MTPTVGGHGPFRGLEAPLALDITLSANVGRRKRENGTEEAGPHATTLPHGDPMFLVREVMYCKPGKVRPLVEKFLKMAKLNEQLGFGKMRVMTDFCGERYWTIVSEFEVPDMRTFEEMMQGAGVTPEAAKQFDEIMKGYHDLVDHGRREIYKIEG